VIQKRKLIEVALPLEAINLASAAEKSPFVKKHPRALHVWWARRPLAACRAVLFASLVDDPSSDPEHFPTPKSVEDERTRLFGIIERLVRWENVTNEVVLEEARTEIRRSTGGNPPPVLDPFCGGGSIPLEAQRLGLTAYASDLNPVAVLITKALIEIPPKFANRPPVHPDARRGIGGTGAWKGAAGLAEDVRRYGAWMRDEAERRIGYVYPKVRLPKEQGGGEATVAAWIWARTVECPNPACGARMPLANSFALSTKKGNEAWVHPVADSRSKSVRFEVRTGHGTPPEPPKVGRGASFRCLVCGQVAPDGHVKAEGLAGRMDAQLLAIVADGQRRRVFVAPNDEHERIARSVIPLWYPEGALSINSRHSTPPSYGLTRFQDLFTPRQLVALGTFSDLVGEARDRALHDAVAAGMTDDHIRLTSEGEGATAYADAVATYLGLAISRVTDFCNTIASWDAGNTNMRQLFARQAIPMAWDFAETNLIRGVVTATSAIEWVATTLDALVPAALAHCVQFDAASTNGPSAKAMVSTDPPYYDNVPYSDLSDFFYVWLRRTLGDVHPSLFGTLLAPKDAELVADPNRFNGSKDVAEEHFEAGLGSAFKQMRHLADPAVPLTVFYAFKQAESNDDGEGGSATASTGWETMLEGLLHSGFSIEATWPMRTEQQQRQRAAQSNALASSVVLVCRPRATNAGITTRKDFVSALKQELPDALRTLQHGNIAPVDLAQASIGPGMAVFSRYAKVLEPDGSAMRVRTALALINQALDELLTEQEGEFDADTRWAIAWYEQVGLKDGPSGTAILLTQAKNTSLDGLERAGIVASAKGRVRLLPREEYSSAWDPSTDARVPVWEAMQRLIRALLDDGEASAAGLLARIGGMGDVARDLAYRLYHVAERKGWTEEARAYNALVVAWPDLMRGAEQARSRQPAQASLGLER
jgi:putative DNA methylase